MGDIRVYRSTDEFQPKRKERQVQNPPKNKSTALLPPAPVKVPKGHKVCESCKAIKPRKEFYTKRNTNANFMKSYGDVCRPCFRDHTKTDEYKDKAKYLREKYLLSLVYQFKVRARSVVRSAYTRLGYKKDTATSDLLGCDDTHFMNHLIDSCVARYGSYDPNNDYHIDHILPVATAKTIDDVRRLNHYTNLQLLTPLDNLQKGSRLDFK